MRALRAISVIDFKKNIVRRALRYEHHSGANDMRSLRDLDAALKRHSGANDMRSLRDLNANSSANDRGSYGIQMHA